MIARTLKRVFDVVGSVSALVLLAPLLAAVWVVVRCWLGSPAFFVQERPGLRCRPFRLFKFRTMTDERDARSELLPDAARLLPVGRILRATSLDELPELWNVLRGDMSLIGPRPLLMEYLPLYSTRQARRHEMRPGLTGWAQVNGRNAISWEQRFELDVWYVDNWSLWLDLVILVRTAGKVVAREGVSERGQATMTKFTGNAT
jgi:lipopolysaccharide/colanic/teichoic acid biosynthesis glycosyltransferase